MKSLNQIPTDDSKFACIIKFTIASYNLKSNGGVQLLVNIDYKNNGVLKEASLVDLPISLDSSDDLDKLKVELKGEITSRSCNKKDKEKTGPVEFVKDYRSQSGSSVQSIKGSETLTAK